MTTSVDDLLKIVAMIGIPSICSVVWLVTMLMSIKTDVKRIEIQLQMKNEIHDSRLTHLESGLHLAKNNIQAINLRLAEEGR